MKKFLLSDTTDLDLIRSIDVVVKMCILIHSPLSHTFPLEDALVVPPILQFDPFSHMPRLSPAEVIEASTQARDPHMDPVVGLGP